MKQYIVIGSCWGKSYVCGLRGGVLYNCEVATSFPSLRAAKMAINDSVEYARRHGYAWDDAKYFKIARIGKSAKVPA